MLSVVDMIECAEAELGRGDAAAAARYVQEIKLHQLSRSQAQTVAWLDTRIATLHISQRVGSRPPDWSSYLSHAL
ncbi:MAG TPA: hypothetical protein VFT87_02045 [Candidatus Saccharimonadales bacterium]|nr:hypothetical protein [Candidatus Saccharimonadales bacterium]